METMSFRQATYRAFIRIGSGRACEKSTRREPMTTSSTAQTTLSSTVETDLYTVSGNGNLNELRKEDG
jgi:hypothetical protein